MDDRETQRDRAMEPKRTVVAIAVLVGVCALLGYVSALIS